jgi:NAD(P)-dependent dehydrogenase (short-subunit alcohol dehydrogenase family)
VTKALALEWAPRNIRVRDIASGLIKADTAPYIWGNEKGAAALGASVGAQPISGETIFDDGYVLNMDEAASSNYTPILSTR